MIVQTTTSIMTEGIVKTYDGLKALNGIDLTIRKGEFYVLMGPNGSGKSTLLSIIAGTKQPDCGTVIILGHDINFEKKKSREHIGYIPQQHFCSGFLTGGENLEYFASLLGLSKSESKKKISELLEMMDLVEAADRRVSEYSGGMKKKLEVATALLGDVEVLLLDESTAGLDPNVRRDFFLTLKQINKTGTTIMLVTHLGVDAEVASRIGFMVDGQIIVEGTPDELKERSNLGSEIFLEVTPRDDELLLILADFDDGCIVIERQEGFELHCKESENLIPKIMHTLQNAGYSVQRIELLPPNLEHVFQELTDRPIRGEVC